MSFESIDNLEVSISLNYGIDTNFLLKIILRLKRDLILKLTVAKILLASLISKYQSINELVNANKCNSTSFKIFLLIIYI